VVRASTFLLILVWTFCALKKTCFLAFFFFCGASRIECEKRKAIWDACVAEIKQDPDQKKDFDTQMLAVMDTLGQFSQTDRSMSFCLIACFLRCISLALGATYFWRTSLPSGISGERTPFRFLECDVQGGDANQINGADAALAWIFSQLPFVSGNNPNEIVSLSWPTNMEAQDLFPLTSSTYTFPTGKVDVACYAQNKVVDIERTECPDSFVSPNDPNYDRPCVKVLHGSTRCLHP
jgi:hypothetical protein